jgi:hypothetical protein
MKTQILEKNWIFFDRSIVLKEQHDYDRKNILQFILFLQSKLP